MPTIKTSNFCLLLLGVALAMGVRGTPTNGQKSSTSVIATASNASANQWTFKNHVQPLLKKYCFECHNAENIESGIRVDQLNDTPENKHLFVWKDVLKQIANGAMPPEDKPQPTAEQRRSLAKWIRRTLAEARSRNKANNGSIRRLTVSQYRNTLSDLLGL